MIHHALGDFTFRRGIQRYVKLHLYGSASQDDPWISLNNQAHQDRSLPLGMDLRVLMDSWTKKPGYPVVTAIRDYTTGTVDVIQVISFHMWDADSGGTTGWLNYSQHKLLISR